MAKKLLVFLSILVVCVAVFVACGDPAETTAPDTSTAGTTTPKITETPSTPEQPPVTTTEIDLDSLNPVERYKYETDAIWCGPIHAGVVYNEKTDKDNSSVKYMAFRFGYGSDNGIFGDDPDLNVPGIQLTTPVAVYIKACDEFGESTEEYVKYDLEYYETPNWWEVWFVPKGFTPVDGQSYLITLFIESDDSLAHVYPEHVLFWETYPDEPWTYEAPAPVVSKHGDITTMVPDIKDRTQLYYHDGLSIDEEGNLRYTFKSDNNPFAQVGDIMGLSMTRAGYVVIDGVRYEIADDSYVTEQHYILNFKINGFVPQAGTTYEVIFTIEANDNDSGYCNNQNGYFALNDYTHTATAVEGE